MNKIKNFVIKYPLITLVFLPILFFIIALFISINFGLILSIGIIIISIYLIKNYKVIIIITFWIIIIIFTYLGGLASRISDSVELEMCLEAINKDDQELMYFCDEQRIKVNNQNKKEAKDKIKNKLIKIESSLIYSWAFK